MTKKNNKILITDLLIGLRVSEGFIARSVILIPYRKPIASAGPNKMFERIGDSSLMFVI